MLISSMVTSFTIAQTTKGSFIAFVDEKNIPSHDGVSLGKVYSQVAVSWKIWDVLGDPLYDITAATILPSSISAYDGEKTYYLPKKIIEKIYAYDIDIKLKFESGQGKHYEAGDDNVLRVVYSTLSNYYTDWWDSGAPAYRSYIDDISSYTHFADESKEVQSKYFSYHVTSAPSWDKLFYKYSSDSDAINKEEAISFYKRKLKVVGQEIRVKWNISAVSDYINKLKNEDQEKSNINETTGQQNEEDFWGEEDKNIDNSSFEDSYSDVDDADNKGRDDFFASEDSGIGSIVSNEVNYKSLRGSNGLYGFKNSNGEKVLPCIFERVEEFKNGFAIVKSKGKKGVINVKGHYVIQPEYINIWHTEKGFTAGKYLGKILAEADGYKLVSNTYTYFTEQCEFLKTQKVIYSSSPGFRLTGYNFDESIADRERREREREKRIKKEWKNYHKVKRRYISDGYFKID